MAIVRPNRLSVALGIKKTDKGEETDGRMDSWTAHYTRCIAQWSDSDDFERWYSVWPKRDEESKREISKYATINVRG